MNPLLTLAAAAAITVFHIWASRRRPRYWYLGGIVPALWVAILIFLLANGAIRPAEDYRHSPAHLAGGPSGRQEKRAGAHEGEGSVTHKAISYPFTKGASDMRALLVLLLTFVILAVQFHLGLRKRKLLGAVLPAVMAALFVFISLAGKTTEYIATGSLCVIAIVIVWAVGYAKSAKHEKAALDKMRAKDL